MLVSGIFLAGLVIVTLVLNATHGETSRPIRLRAEKRRMTARDDR